MEITVGEACATVSVVTGGGEGTQSSTGGCNFPFLGNWHLVLTFLHSPTKSAHLMKLNKPFSHSKLIDYIIAVLKKGSQGWAMMSMEPVPLPSYLMCVLPCDRSPPHLFCKPRSSFLPGLCCLPLCFRLCFLLSS